MRDGLYDRLIDEPLSAELASLIQANHASVLALSAEERSARLAKAFVKILTGILDGVEPDEAGTPREQAQMAVIAGLLGLLRKEYGAADVPSWPRPLSALRSIHRQSAPFAPPATGVLRPWLFTAGRADPSLLADLRAELDSADEVDILVSFIKWSGVRIVEYFDARPDNRPAVELRLWHALDQQLLAPFEYYGTADETDLSEVKWNGGAQEIADLDRWMSLNLPLASRTA